MGGGARAPVYPTQLPQEVVSRGEFCARIHTVVSVGERAVDCDAKVNRSVGVVQLRAVPGDIACVVGKAVL